MWSLMSATEEQHQLLASLLTQGRALHMAPREPINFQTGSSEADRLMNNIDEFPHLFVLGCVMDRQINFGRAWIIPYRVGEFAGGFRFTSFKKLSSADLEHFFEKKKLHRFNKVTAQHFFKAINKIHAEYDGDASKIWRGTPSSALVIRRFLEFDGVGIKIATMAANILVREFKIPMRDLSAIDISPDRRVTRFFKENGFLRSEASPAELIYLARELSPDFPGLLDYGAFIAGEYQRK